MAPDSTWRFDTLVLGAGIVGVSAALALQERGLHVALLDRQAPGRATSFGNAGLIELSARYPMPFPRGLATMWGLALNRSQAVRYESRQLRRLAPWLFRYWRASRGAALERAGAGFRALLAHAAPEHRRWAEAAGAADLLRPVGWLDLCRTPRQFARARHEARTAQAAGQDVAVLTGEEVALLEPCLSSRFAGALHWRAPISVVDPGGLVEALARLFVARGGRLMTGDAGTLVQDGDGWAVTAGDRLRALRAVVALGPWSGDLLERFGYRVPLAPKRGYHVHYALAGGRRLQRPVYVRDDACLLLPMRQGVRLTTGVELAERDAPPSARELPRLEAAARRALPLADRLDAEPWMGSRPCLPDMLPVIGQGRHPGLWFAFGHGHYGLTLGPPGARLLADLMTGAPPLVPPAPYAWGRFA